MPDSCVSHLVRIASIALLVFAAAGPAAAATISGTVFEDVNYGGGAGRSRSASAGVPLANARVELYRVSNGNLIDSDTTDGSGQYSLSTGGNNSAHVVRVVNGTVRSSRNVACTTCVAIQTFRTDASSGTAIAVTDRVGGENPALIDAPWNTGKYSALTSGSHVPQSIATANPDFWGTSIQNVDFGFNFSTVVATRDASNCAPSGTNNSTFPCQGTLRQFIINANTLGGSLSQSGSGQVDGSNSFLPSGYDSSIFMIPDGTTNPGQSGYANQLSGGVAVITLAATLPAVTRANVRLDATTQTVNVGNTNGGSSGSGGTVGALNTSFPSFARPEVQVAASGTGITEVVLSGTSQHILGLALPRGTITLSGANAVARNNFVGIGANGSPDSGSGMGIAFTGSNALVRGNYVSVNNSGIRGDSPGTGANVLYNEVIRSSGTPTNTFDGILLIGSASNARIENNITRNQGGAGIELGFGSGSMGNIVITNNSVLDNGFMGSGAGAEPVGIAAWSYSGSAVVISLNRIEGNAGPGVMMSAVSGTQITQNRFSNNGGLSIDLYPTNTDPNSMGTPNGPTLNDNGDGDSGANDLLNFPVITAVTIANGEFSAAGFAQPGSKIELYVAQPDPSGFGEGLTYIGTYTEGVNDLDSTTGSYSGAINGRNQGSETTNRFLFRSTSIPSGISAGAVLTSTATLGNQTSEFGGNVTVTGGPNLIHSKSVVVESDPYNNTANPKSIPGSIQLYTIRITNQASGQVDNNSIDIVDSIPANTALCGLAGPSVTFQNGSPSSALTFNATTNVSYSTTASGAPVWGYSPSPDAGGCDAAIRHIRISPRGAMAGSSVAGNPYFEVKFRVRVQ